MMNNQLKAIVIDDESAARNVLKNLLDWSEESIVVVDEADHLVKGVEIIKKHQPEVVFLDVQMPDYAGYEIVQFFDQIDFEIIFVTAFDQYAIKAFELSALDYLVKPIDRDRLDQALLKVRKSVTQRNLADNYNVLKEVVEKKEVKKIVISEIYEGHIQQRLLIIKDIIAVEAQRAYCLIYLKNSDSLLVSKNLKSFEELLPIGDPFIRTHRSWLVNATLVERINIGTGTVVLSDNIIAKLTKANISNLEKAMQR